MRMKYGTCAVFIFFLCSCNNTRTKISINSDFEHGSMGSLIEVSENLFRGQTMHWIKKDKNGNQFYWFYFQMDGLPKETITIQLDNLTGIYRGHQHEVFTEFTQPVLSYDQENWERITDVTTEIIGKSAEGRELRMGYTMVFAGTTGPWKI